MVITIQSDPENGAPLAVYLKVRKGTVSRTVEVAENACYVDEDSKGNLLGIEMTAPGELLLYVKKVARKYGERGLTQAFRNAQAAMA
jgi:uncharacterized protein YuzE